VSADDDSRGKIFAEVDTYGLSFVGVSEDFP